jgi:hypothetical protein
LLSLGPKSDYVGFGTAGGIDSIFFLLVVSKWYALKILEKNGSVDY